jgi:hypothetical protein
MSESKTTAGQYPVEAWAARVVEMIQLIEGAGEALASLAGAMPTGLADVETLAALNALWKRLGCGVSFGESVAARANLLEGRIEQGQHSCKAALRHLLQEVLDARVRLVDEGVVDPACPQLRKADFGPDGLHREAGDEKTLFGRVSALPLNHWGRGLLPDAELYDLLGVGKCLVLGAQRGQELFDAGRVAELTRERRRLQLRAQEDREAGERVRLAQERERLLSSPDTRLKALEAEVAELKALLRERVESNGAALAVADDEGDLAAD